VRWYIDGHAGRNLKEGNSKGSNASDGSDDAVDVGGVGSCAGATEETTRKTSSSHDLLMHEGRAAIVLSGLEEGALLVEEQAVLNGESVGDVGLVLDPSVEDVPRAGGAEVLGGGVDEEEGDVVAHERASVGDDVSTLRGVEGRLEGSSGSSTGKVRVKNTPVAILVLGANGLLEGGQGIESVIQLLNTPLSLGEILRAGDAKVGDLLGQGPLGARG